MTGPPSERVFEAPRNRVLGGSPRDVETDPGPSSGSGDASQDDPFSPGHLRGKAMREGTVLIVEDDDDSRYVYCLMLESNGYRVITATTGQEGVQLAKQEMPRVVLMDVSIPGIDGWTATRWIKGDPDTAAIAVIIITAHAFPEDRRMAKEVGCDGFLTKPCEPREVLEEVHRVTGA